MRLARALCLFPFALVTAPPAHAQMATITPEQVGQIFCIGSLGNDMTPVDAMLSDDLRTLTTMAWERNTAFELAHPGDKPPLGDGLPWRSLSDYADGCAVGTPVVNDLVARVPINYSFSEYPGASYTNYLILLPAHYADGDPMIWRIDDIDLGDGRTMRAFLGTLFDP